MITINKRTAGGYEINENNTRLFIGQIFYKSDNDDKFSLHEENGDKVSYKHPVSDWTVLNEGTPLETSTAEELNDALAVIGVGFSSASGSSEAESAKVLYMELNSSQDLNVISPFTDLDFIQVTNTIPGASVNSAFPIGQQTYKGVVTLPAGKYETSFKINAENGNNTQKVIVVNISRYAPSVIYYPQSTVFEMFRNRNFATLSNPEANYNFLELTEQQSFGIIAARASTPNGTVNTVQNQSFWKIKKIG